MENEESGGFRYIFVCKLREHWRFLDAFFLSWWFVGTRLTLRASCGRSSSRRAIHPDCHRKLKRWRDPKTLTKMAENEGGEFVGTKISLSLPVLAG